MPLFFRYNRHLQRIFFACVILAGLYGWNYATSNWSFDISLFDFSALTDQTDWMETVAALLEQAIQLFLALTSQ
jgi:TRAP-type C4-dicarboxylate transport system permease small subunit